MRHFLSASVLFFSLVAVADGAVVSSLSDIQFWAGSGANQAALVIDWNDGKEPQSLAWGFRWDDTATGQTMLDAIKAADPRLTQTPGGGGPATVYGLGYDLDGDGFAVSGSGDTATPSDPDDHYRAGWFSSGFWSYWVNSTGQSTLPNQANVGDPASRWQSSGGSYTQRALVNNGWDGWSFAPGFSSSRPSEPTAVPEPPGAALATMLVAGCFVRRRRAAVACGAILVTASIASAQGIVANRVVNYSTGTPLQSVWWDTTNTYTQPTAALGMPVPDTGTDPFASYGAVTPFNPPFQTNHIVRVSAGGALELELSAAVVPTAGPEIGVFVNNGITDVSPGGTGVAKTYTTDPEELYFSPAPRAIVSVKSNEADAWVPLSASPIAFLNPTNFYTDTSIANYFAPLGTDEADFFQPFTGTLADFSGKTYAEMLTMLAGSAGGSWLDISGAGLSSVRYIRFEVPAGESYRMMIDAVTAVPEPGGAVLALLASAMMLRRKR